MEIMLADIVETLDASEVKLPGGLTIAEADSSYLKRSKSGNRERDCERNTADDGQQAAPALVRSVSRNDSDLSALAQQVSELRTAQADLGSQISDSDESYDEGVEVDLDNDKNAISSFRNYPCTPFSRMGCSIAIKG